MVTVMVFLVSCQPPGVYHDAVAVWHLSGLQDATEENSRLEPHGAVQFVPLAADGAKASKARGADGMAAHFDGGWLDAGQGVNDELNLTGKNISLFVRIKAADIHAFAPVLTKAGNDQNVAYGIALNPEGGDVYIEVKAGSDEIAGAHLLKYKLPAAEIHEWHDILFRFDGQLSELYVDGILRDDEVTAGEIRDWNRQPLLIGAQYKSLSGDAGGSASEAEATFNGLIDLVALWNRRLSDEEIMYLSNVTGLKDGKPVYYTEKYRPQFHFSARKNWINDPNGLVFYDGVYHLFFQYMPPHRPGAYKDWGHAVSTDLVHWEQTSGHITPHKVWGGCWSGSAVVDTDNSAGFQTGDAKAIVAFITNGGEPHLGLGPMCTQCIAYSTDGGKTFAYHDRNPVIRNVSNANRDPKVVWDEMSKKWIMSLYMDVGNDFGLFASANLKEWTFLGTVTIDGVRECPGFEPLPVDGDPSNRKWMFLGANGDYRVGSFDGTAFTPETNVLRGDYGVNFYAPQIWSNAPDGRRLLIAWMPTQRYPGMPFEQQMNFPTEVTLRTTARGIKAFRMPVREIENLYDREYLWENHTLKAGENLFEELKDELYDMELEVDVKNSSSFEIVLRNVTVSYDAVKRMLSCGGNPVNNGIIPDNWISSDKAEINASNNLGRASLSPVEGTVKLRILLDRTTIEVFGNDGEVVITSCYMPEDSAPNYLLTAKSTLQIASARVHSLKSAWNGQAIHHFQ